MENNNLENVTEILDDKQLEEKKKKATLSIVYYFIIMYFFGTIAQVILMFIAPLITGVELMNPETMEIYQPNMDFIMSWTQIIIYITLTVGLVILTRKYLLNYFEDFKNNWKKLSLEIIIPILLGGILGVTSKINNFSNTNMNNNIIQQLIHHFLPTAHIIEADSEALYWQMIQDNIGVGIHPHRNVPLPADVLSISLSDNIKCYGGYILNKDKDTTILLNKFLDKLKEFNIRHRIEHTLNFF